MTLQAGALNQMVRGSQWGERSAEQRGDLGSPASTSGQSLESPGRLESPVNRLSVQASNPSFRSLLKSQSLRPRLGGEPSSEDDKPPAGALQVFLQIPACCCLSSSGLP